MYTKILIEYEVYGQTAEMLHAFFLEMQNAFKIQINAKRSIAIKNTDIQWSDVIISVRSTCSISSGIAALCKKLQRFHIVLLDDNLFNHRRQDWFMKRRQKALGDTLHNTDLLLTPNPLLAKDIGEAYAVKRSAHIDTTIHESEITPFAGHSAPVGDVVRIVYYSNDGTSSYFTTLLAKAFEEISKSNRYKIEMTLIGIETLTDSLGCSQVKLIPHLSYTDFKKFLRNGHFDIGLAPVIEDDDFSKYKYFNKYMEYSAAGIPGIYSNCPPYTFVIKDGYNGFLSNNTTGDWQQAIISGIENNENRVACIQNAQHSLKTDFSFEKVSTALLQEIPELLTYRAPKVKTNGMKWVKLKYSVFIFSERIDSTFRTMRQSGFCGLVRRTMLFIRTNKQTAHERREMQKKEGA
ncbi:MAG: glycosyltransferase [Clostridiales bacterium]|nr:glycosyltransferase [Clostridiales bacterium]